MHVTQTLHTLKMRFRNALGVRYLAVYLLLAWVVYVALPTHKRHPPHRDQHAIRLGRELFPKIAYVIALDDMLGVKLAISINESLQVNTHFVQADRGVRHGKNLHLFTRYMMDTGRVDHKLIGNYAMVGCLMSHVKIWRNLTEPAFIFEEDAVLDGENTRDLIASQLYEASAFNWSVLMLTQRYWFGSVDDDVSIISPLLATCTSCRWYGTRGYIITPVGASILLEYYLPLLVQVDGIIALANAYDDRFRMLWVLDPTVLQVSFRASTIQTTPCPKCSHLDDYIDPRRW
jgi:GR25 family glycosyltransferase involved in LPS biosynthesis